MNPTLKTIAIVGAVLVALALVFYAFQNYRHIEITQKNSAHKDKLSIEVEKK